jgi:osmotically-inducible protein OsmY
MAIGNPYILAAALLLAVPVLAQNSAQQNNENHPAGVARNAAGNAAENAAGNAAADTAAPVTEPEAIPALPASEYKNAPASQEERITRKVRHLLVMRPAYSIWDWLAFRVNGNTVELLGDVYSGGLKHDAIDAVREIDGVGRVIDHIRLLTPSPVDDRIRHEVANAIYSGGTLSRYSWSAMPSIHIIVSGGQVRLEGLVDNQPDKDAAALCAKGVSGVLQVTNNLRLEQD